MQWNELTPMQRGLMLDGPFERGSKEWEEREKLRFKLGCKCYGFNTIAEPTRVASVSHPRIMPSKKRQAELIARQSERITKENGRNYT